jgi:hypothetical protein
MILSRTLAALFVAYLGCASLSHAATITVNTVSATSVVGQCALIDAVQAANTNTAVNGCVAGSPGLDTIVFANTVSVIDFTMPLSGTTEALRISEDLTIDGSNGSYGTAGVRIQRNPAATLPFRIFKIMHANDINADAPELGLPTYVQGPTVSMRKLEVALGALGDNSVNINTKYFGYDGGCIATSGVLNLTDVTVRDCRTTASNILDPSTGKLLRIDGCGGGIYSDLELYGVRLTVTGNSTSARQGLGGGICSYSRLWLDDSYVGQNSTSGTNAAGGGFYHSLSLLSPPDARFYMTGSTVEQNTTSGDNASGGGLNIKSAVSMLANLIANNRTSGVQANGGGMNIEWSSHLKIFNGNWFSNNWVSGDWASGGGLYADATNSLMSFDGNTFSTNHAYGAIARGGGLWLQGAAILSNNTFNLNTTPGINGLGAGLYLAGKTDGQTITIANNTIAENTSSANNGGGVYICDADNTFVGPLPNRVDNCTNNTPLSLRLESNIILGNGTGLDVVADVATTASGIKNIIGTSRNVAAAGVGSGCQPGLLALDYNGGRQLGFAKVTIPTMALPRTSCAVDAGSNPLSRSEDQRGNTYSRDQGLATDVGAFETIPRPSITLKKIIIGTPSVTDASRFNLSIVGNNLSGGTNPALNVGHNGSTGAVKGDDGATVTISESAGSGSSLANYVTSLACDFATPTMLNATTATIVLPNYAIASFRDVTCTFTNAARITLTTMTYGDGTVTSNIGGINCGPSCRSVYAAGSSVVLTAIAAPGAHFAGWTGACAGIAVGNICTLAVNGDVTANAVFTQDFVPALPVPTLGSGALLLLAILVAMSLKQRKVI